MANPYQMPTTSLSPSKRYGWHTGISALAWAYPFVLMSGFYGTWLAAWLVLGHIPRPSLDDPARISWIVTILYGLTGLLLVAMLPALLIGAMLKIFNFRYPLLRRFLHFGLFVMLWAVTILFLRWDPVRVIEWYMD